MYDKARSLFLFAAIPAVPQKAKRKLREVP